MNEIDKPSKKITSKAASKEGAISSSTSTGRYASKSSLTEATAEDLFAVDVREEPSPFLTNEHVTHYPYDSDAWKTPKPILLGRGYSS
jgi:hypothetical protein